MTQPTHIEETIQRFNEKFEFLLKKLDNYYGDGGGNKLYDAQIDFLRTTLTQLVEKDLEWAEMKKRDIPDDHYRPETDNEAYNIAGRVGYNNALTDFINHKREQ